MAQRSLLARVGADTSAFNRQMRGLGVSAEGAGRRGRIAFAAVGVALGAVTALATKAVKEMAEFQGAMNAVEAVTGATDAQMKEMAKTARDLGATTAFTAKQAGEGMKFLGMAGFNTDQILKAIPATLDLAAAGALELAEAADIATNVLTGFGLSADETTRVVDVLAFTAANSNTDIRQMGEAMTYVSGFAKSLGLELEETSAAIGALANVGIRGSMAGTSIGNAFATLLLKSKKLVPGLIRSKEEMNALRVSMVDAETGGVKPLVEIIEILETASLNTTETLELFGRRGARAIEGLMEEGSANLRKTIKEMKELDDFAHTMARTMLKDLPGAFKEMSSAMGEVMLAIGDKFAPAVDSFIRNQLTPWLRTLGDIIKANDILGGLSPIPTDEQIAQYAKANEVIGLYGQFNQEVAKALRHRMFTFSLMGMLATKEAALFNLGDLTGRNDIKFLELSGRSVMQQRATSAEINRRLMASLMEGAPPPSPVAKAAKAKPFLGPPIELYQEYWGSIIDGEAKMIDQRLIINQRLADDLQTIAQKRIKDEETVVTALREAHSNYLRATGEEHVANQEDIRRLRDIELGKWKKFFEQKRITEEQYNNIVWEVNRTAATKIGKIQQGIVADHGKGVAKMGKTWKTFIADAVKEGGSLRQGAIDIFNTIRDEASTLLFDALKGEITSFTEFARRAGDSILKIATRVFVEIVVQAVLMTETVKKLVGWLSGKFDKFFETILRKQKEKPPFMGLISGALDFAKSLGIATTAALGLNAVMSLLGGSGGGRGIFGALGNLLGLGGGGQSGGGTLSSILSLANTGAGFFNLGNALLNPGAIGGTATPPISSAVLGNLPPSIASDIGATGSGGLSGLWQSLKGPLGAAGAAATIASLLAKPLDLNQPGATVGAGAGAGIGFAIGGPAGAVIGGAAGLFGGGSFGPEGSSSARALARVNQFYRRSINAAETGEGLTALRWLRDAMHQAQASAKAFPIFNQVGNLNWVYSLFGFLDKNFGSAAGGAQRGMTPEKYQRLLGFVDSGQGFDWSLAGDVTRQAVAMGPLQALAQILNTVGPGEFKGKVSTPRTETAPQTAMDKNIFDYVNSPMFLGMRHGGITTGVKPVAAMLSERPGLREAVIPLTPQNLRMLRGDDGGREARSIQVNIEINNRMLDADSANTMDWRGLVRQKIMPEVSDAFLMAGEPLGTNLEIFK